MRCEGKGYDMKTEQNICIRFVPINVPSPQGEAVVLHQIPNTFYYIYIGIILLNIALNPDYFHGTSVSVKRRIASVQCIQEQCRIELGNHTIMQLPGKVSNYNNRYRRKENSKPTAIHSLFTFTGGDVNSTCHIDMILVMATLVGLVLFINIRAFGRRILIILL